jgi:hypothetical protein
MRKVQPLLMLSLLMICTGSVAQKRYLPGQVVLHSFDTLKGFIQEIPGRINPYRISFRATPDAQPVEYKPADIQWFSYNGGDRYVSYIGPLETSSLNTNNLTYDSALATITDTLFIRAVLIGRASLYYARDRNDRIHLFLQKFGGRVTELGYKKYYVDEIVLANYQTKIVKRAIYDNQLYKGQLIQAFRDCPYVATGITSRPLPYAKNEIQEVFEDYNRCKGAKVIYREPEDNGTLAFTLNAGVNFCNLKFESESYPPWNDYHFNSSAGFAGGLGCDFLLPRTRGKWGFFNEVSLERFKTDGYYESPENLLKLDLVYVKIATMMRYYLTTDRYDFRPYTAFGFSNNFTIREVQLNYTNEPEGEPILEFFRQYEQGIIIGAGTYYKRWNTELRYEASNGISDYTSLRSPMHTAYILVGFKLFSL